MKCLMALDISNLYMCIQNKFGEGKRLNFVKLVEFCEDFGTIDTKLAYCCFHNESSRPFINYLKSNNFTVRQKQLKEFPKANGRVHRKGDWDVGITVEIMEKQDWFDTLILCTSDGDFTPLVKHLLAKGKKVIVIGAQISGELKQFCDRTIEIPESLLYAAPSDEK